MVSKFLKLFNLAIFICLKMFFINFCISIVIDAFDLLSLEGVDKLQFIFCVLVVYMSFFSMFVYNACIDFKEYLDKKTLDITINN